MFYCEQQAIIQAHMDPKSFKEMDAEEWSNVVSAKPKKDRPVDAAEYALSQLTKGKTRKEVR